MKTKVQSNSRSKPNNQLFSDSKKASFFSAQTKLKVGEPGDKYEQEADRVADEVMQKQNEPAFFAPSQSLVVQTKTIAENITPLMQRQEEEEEAQTKLEVQRQEEEEEMQMQPMEEEEEMLQTQPMEEEEESIQTKNEDVTSESSPSTEQKLKLSRGNGSNLDALTRTQMETGFGADFSGVKIHTNSTAVQMNKELGAHAFTWGNDIYFNKGKYQANSEGGKRLLAHELTHTIQQGASVASDSIQRWPDYSLEVQKLLFRNRNYGPMTYTNPSSSGSGFEARYNPRSGRFDVTVRAKVRFADSVQGSAGSLTSPNIFMSGSSFLRKLNGLPADVASRVLPYFQWNDRQKRIHMIRFRDNLRVVQQMWQGTGMTFQVDETGWEDITASPRVNLAVTEGDAVHDRITGSVGGFSFDFTNSVGSDHLQIELVKQVSAAEATEVANIINTHDATLAITSNDARSTRSYMFNDPGSRNSAPEGFNNIMSLESDSLGDTSNRYYDQTVYFGNNENELSDEQVAILEGFLNDPMILLDNEDRAVDITLFGYASAPGTTEYNVDLVERRMIEVEGRINEIAARSDISANISGSFYPINDSDFSAEEDRALNPGTHDPAEFRRVEVAVEREGTETQNVLAHEFGHVFGLGDEYAEVSAPDAHGNRRYNRPTGSAASHNQLAIDAGVTGGATVADDNRMMSGGNEMGAAHYSTFADALKQLTLKQWKIIT